MGKSPPNRGVDSRTRLLNSLGMFQQQQQPSKRPPRLLQADRSLSATTSAASPLSGEASSPSSTSSSSSSSPTRRPTHHARRWSDIPTRSALHNAAVFETKLKDQSAARSRKSNFFSSNAAKHHHHHRKTNSMVRFNAVVEGVEIPSRTQYSKRIKQSLWRDRDELQEMVQRNKEEFHFENYDWRKVVEDDDMYVDSINGELVHPCHVQVPPGYEEEEDDTTSSSEDFVEEKKQTESTNDSKDDDGGFVPLGQQGKSTWEVL